LFLDPGTDTDVIAPHARSPTEDVRPDSTAGTTTIAGRRRVDTGAVTRYQAEHPTTGRQS